MQGVIMPSEARVIQEIARRAASTASTFGVVMDRERVAVQLMAVHSVVPLRLDAMRSGPLHHMFHDLAGIVRHFNAEAGEFERGFWPRYAIKQ